MGNQKKIQLGHDLFEYEKSSISDLLVSISENNISYAIINKEEELLQVLVDVEISLTTEEAIHDLIENDTLLKLPYRKIKVCINTQDFTFIPQALYSDLSLPLYSRFTDAVDHHDVLINTIRPARIKNVFSVPATLKNKLTDVFAVPQVFNQATVFIEGIRRIFRESDDDALFLNLQYAKLQLAIINRKGLKYYNMFDCNTADDLNYFLLLIIQKVELNLTSTSITISGEISVDSNYYDRIKKYFNEIIFSDSKRIINQSAVFNKLSSHAYFALLSINVCE